MTPASVPRSTTTIYSKVPSPIAAAAVVPHRYRLTAGCTSLTSSERARARAAGRFEMLKQSGCFVVDGVDDGEMLNGTLDAMTNLGISDDEISFALDVTAAIPPWTDRLSWDAARSERGLRTEGCAALSLHVAHYTPPLSSPLILSPPSSVLRPRCSSSAVTNCLECRCAILNWDPARRGGAAARRLPFHRVIVTRQMMIGGDETKSIDDIPLSDKAAASRDRLPRHLREALRLAGRASERGAPR